MTVTWIADRAPPAKTWIWASDGVRTVRMQHPGGALPFGNIWAYAPPIGGLMFVVCLLGVFIGCSLVGLLQTESSRKWQPLELTQQEREAGAQIQPTVPFSMVLRIMEPSDIRAISPTADALTFLGKYPCEIVFPAGRQIVFSPQMKAAAWVHPSDGDILAHEILHCLRGFWYGKPDGVGSRKK